MQWAGGVRVRVRVGVRVRVRVKVRVRKRVRVRVRGKVRVKMRGGRGHGGRATGTTKAPFKNHGVRG